MKLQLAGTVTRSQVESPGQHLARYRQELEANNARLRRRNRELSALYAVSNAVAGPLPLLEVMNRALRQTIEVSRALGGWLCILDNEGLCELFASAGQPVRPDIRAVCCRKCPVCEEAAATQQALIVSPLPAGCLLRGVGDTDGGSAIGHITVPLMVKERAVGLLSLVLDEADCASVQQEDLHLLAAIGRQMGIAIENARLWEELRHREVMRGQLLRKIITIQEDERQRISRELHDEAGQTLTSLLIGLSAIERTEDLDKVRALSANLREAAAQTLSYMHNLALELRPMVLDDLGLVAALERFVHTCPDRFGFQTDFVTAGMAGQRLPREVETVLYRVAQEALTNVARHARASHATVLLERRDDTVVLVIEDDGQGFDRTGLADSPEKRDRIGLFGMEERASLVGGRLVMESAPGAGTTVSVEIPLGENGT